jgi:hypothetical protein
MSLDPVSHGLGRLEGKLDLVLLRLDAIEAAAASAVLEHKRSGEHHNRRITNLEHMAARVGGISLAVSAVVGFLSAWVKVKLHG